MNKTLRIIEQAAIAGDRCPVNESLPYNGTQLRNLARDGEILIEVFEKNFRRVTILGGLHAGKRTADPPRKFNGKEAQPYLTISKAGTVRNGKHVEPLAALRSRPQPSLPRTIPSIARDEPEPEEHHEPDVTPYRRLNPWQPPEFKPANAFDDVRAKLTRGKA